MERSKFVEKVKPHESGFLSAGSHMISHIDMELTERCDNNCVHCSINIPENSPEKKKELNTADWKRIIKQAADLGVLKIRFTGGEPLLREDFPDLYLFTRKLGIKVIIFTNARKITSEIAKLLSKIPPLEKIEVSVYGMSRESYEKVSRVPGSYEEFRSGIDLLLKNNIPFIVKGILLPDNISEKEEFESWASTLPWMDQSPSYSSNFELRERRDSNSKNRMIDSLRNVNDNIVGKNSEKKKLTRSKIEFLSNFIGPPGPELFACGAGQSGSVDAYGFIHPCLTLKADEYSYDLKTGTIKEAIFKFFPEKLNVKAANPEYLKRCSNCFLKGLCLQCPSRAWSENGTFDSPVEYLCNVAHKEAKDIGLLTGDEKGWEVTDWKERIKKLEEKGDDRDR